MTDAYPDTIPTEFQDQVAGIFASLGAAGSLYLVLDFAAPLDPAALRQATRRLLDAEPVLGCRFDDIAEPVWRRRQYLDADPGFSIVDDVEDLEAETSKITGAVFDLRRTANLTVWLLRHRGGDRLIMAVSHAVADGGAAVMALERLARLYSGIAEDPDFRLPPNSASRYSFSWLTSFGLLDKLKVLARDLAEMPRMLRRQQGFQRSRAEFNAAQRTRPASAGVSIPADRLAAIDAVSKARGLSRNDLLVAGFARAFIAFCRGDPGRSLQIVTPVNLRRFAEAETRPAICNLGGIANVTIEPDLGACFGDTLDRAAREMARQRKSFMGAANPYTARLFAAMPYARKRRLLDRMMDKGLAKPVPPTFTNVGRIQQHRIRFAGTAPDRVALYGTPLPLPMVVVVAVEYGRTMTLTMSYDLSDYAAADVERFLSDIVNAIVP
jgi:NRPS condensation-like uncharacterized protein